MCSSSSATAKTREVGEEGVGVGAVVYSTESAESVIKAAMSTMLSSYLEFRHHQ